MSDTRERLKAAGQRRRNAVTEHEAADAETRAAIHDALRDGLTITEIAELSGYHRNSIRAMRDH